MALRIRRGLEADRLSVTPDEGEYLYCTDTKLLYIGDGTTAGGNLISGAGAVVTVSDTANIDLTVTGNDLTADLTDTTVTPSTYGDATNIPQITVDQKGRVTSVTDIPVSIPSGTVTSVGLTMPSAFTVANSPITSSGDIAVTGAGLVSQYVRGDGSLANFPTSTGGGASQSFYLNGSVSQGTFGGVAFREMDRVPILGAGTDFTINTNGYIQSFITDANVPNLLEIPAGNWNFETYFSASSGGGSPSFYLELYKWNGTTLSLIASSSANPEGITNGTAIDLYLTALAVPQTALLATDRLAVRIYVNNSGRTITLHTENNHLCQVITTFSTGITALNGLTDQVQNLAVGTSGTDFAINSATGTHTFNLPTASAANRGALSSADWSTFNGKQNALGFTPEDVANKQTDLTASATKYPTVDAVNSGLALKQDKLLISSATASNSAVIDFTLPSGYYYFEVFIDYIVPQTDATGLLLVVSTDGGATFRTGATDYGRHLNILTGAAGTTPLYAYSATVPNISFIGNLIGNTATDFFRASFRLFDPSNSTKRKYFTGEASVMRSDNQPVMLTLNGIFNDTPAVNAIRLYMSSGNIASGEFKLYGYK
jgi:hypothetical protein